MSLVPEPKRGLRHGEKKEWDKIMSRVQRYQVKLTMATTSEEWDSITAEIEKATEPDNKRLYEIISDCYGIPIDQFDAMPNKTVEEMIDRLYKESQLSKNGSEPSQKPSSSETTQAPK